MQIIGHRGAAGLAPENTIASIKAAIKAGVDAIEFDVHATRDGRVVVAHDKTLLRIAKRPMSIARSTYAQLHKVTFKGGHHIPTLAEAFNAIVGQAHVVIEIKAKGCASAVVSNIERLVKQGATYKEFRVSSFSTARLREVWERNDKIPLVLLQAHAPYRFTHITGMELVGVGFYHRLMPKRAIELAHQHGLNVYAYTINSVQRAQQLKNLGVDGIYTNRPDAMQESRKKS